MKKLNIVAFIFFLSVMMIVLSTAASAAVPANWKNTSWPYRHQITIDHTKVSSSINNFPVLIDFTDSGMIGLAKSDGTDIFFTAGDGRTNLAFELENYSSGHVVAWVKTNLSSTQDTTLYMYYGNKNAASQANPNAVWDSNYLAVHHLEETINNVSDSTAYNNNGSALNGVRRGISGKIDGAYQFDGSNDRVGLPKIFTAQNQFTFEAWVYLTNETKTGAVVSQRNMTPSQGAYVQYVGNVNKYFEFYFNSNYARKASVGQNVWQYMVATFDGTTGRLYINDGTPATATGSVTWPATVTAMIGDRYNRDRPFTGIIDEVRFSSVARSEAYIRTSYANQNDPASFFSVSAQERISAPPEIINKFPLQNAVDIELSPVLQFYVKDIDNDSVQWTVQLFNSETSWETIAQGTVPSGNALISVSNTSKINQFETPYSWKVTATDPSGSGIISEQVYNFVTRQEINYPPFVREPYPANGSTEIPINPNLQATLKDIDGNSFNWTVELWNGLTWQSLGSGKATSGETNINISTTSITNYETSYSWRIIAKDTGSGKTTNATLVFKTKPANHIPDIDNVWPANGSAHIPLNPTFTARIADYERDRINWSVELLSGNTWNKIGSGSSSTGNFTISVPTTTITNYETAYSWRINATDSGSNKTNSIVYNFTSRKERYEPEIISTTPKDGETAVARNITVMAFVEDKDGQNMDITFSFYNSSTGTWRVMRTYQDVPTGNYTASGTGYFTKAMTNYKWKVTADDHTGFVTEKEFTFTTGGLLNLKWTASFGNSGGDQIMPVMGDIDNDGTQEIVMASGTNIVAVNGKTGQVEWSVPGGASTAVELVDINKDGVPEILHGMDGARIRALDGRNPTVPLWTTRVGGDGQSIFPILAYDIDGDGYPTIYFATEDTAPDPYSGNLSDYNGALTMLDHNGRVLRSTWIFHPCWGGMSIGDVNYDGKFELYISDRRARGYLDNNASLGPHAYDAETLELLWSRKDIQHSSPIPMIADVLGDDKLEVVLTPITMKGPMIVDALTGETILDYTNRSFPTHGVASIYDLDDDGNMEIVMASSYPDSAPSAFYIFDLITGQTELEQPTEYPVAWPPKLGDVDGDGSMEVLVAQGPQSWGFWNYPLLIYKYDPNLKNYTLIDSVKETAGIGQLMPIRVYDTDSDSLNEVVVVGYDGVLRVYDTPAPTPNPAPRTWLQMYSEYRQGAAEYVRPPGAPQPIIKETNIADGAINVQPGVTRLSAWVIDFHYARMNIQISTNVTGTWQTVATFNNAGNGWYNATVSGMNQLNRTYYWRVVATDPLGDNLTTNKTFSFTTTPCSSGLIELTYYNDTDKDGYGNNANMHSVCVSQGTLPPAGNVLDNTDCNDANALINPGATEICDGIDNDCDAATDENVTITYFRDLDFDNYGNATSTIQACTMPIGYVANTTDCNDNNILINPGATEFCDGIDNNCDGVLDDASCSQTNYYCDIDADTYMSSIISGTCTTPGCVPAGCSELVGNDCDDTDADVNPGETEVCNGVDDNCIGGIDEGLAVLTYYLDSDSDTFGNPVSSITSCAQPVGYVMDNTDCNDNSNTAYPGATEACDGIDNNCDTIVDEGCGSAWPYPGWQYRKQITIDHNQVTENLANFPVLIDLTDNDLRTKAQTDGDDILFTSSNGQTKIPHEIEAYTSGTGNLVAWVNVPSLSATEDTILYVYYGNNAAPNQQNPNAVWDSNFLAVHHFQEKSGNAIDSTSNNQNGVLQNGVVQGATGKIDGAYQFDGVNDRVQLPQIYTSQSQFTFEAWVSTQNKQGYMISQRDSSSHGAFLQYFTSTTASEFQLYTDNQKVGRTSSTVLWHRVVGTYDGTNLRIYVDANTPVSAAGILSWPSQPTYIGDRSAAGRAFQGTLDEIRLSNIARSEGYISTSYNNQGSPESFISKGAEESASGTICTDADNDGYSVEGGACGLADCNDNDNSINPGETEACDALDNDCDGSTDESLTRPTTCGVGICLGNTGVETCALGIWGGNTCNPFAGATSEVCSNGIDDDCDGSTDEGCSGSWPYLGWQARKTITIDSTKVSDSLTNFPVLIDLTDDDLLISQDNGNDIFFTGSDGITKLAHEIEKYDSVTGHLVAWVNVPSLSATEDTILYVYYGNNAAASQQNPTAVWDSSYLAVHHLEETSGTVTDSSSNDNDGSALNGVIRGITAKIDGGDTFDGSDDRIQLTQVLTSQSQFTFEAWVNTGAKQGYVVSQRDGSGNGAFLQYFPSENNFQFYINSVTLKRPGTANTWQYVVGTFDGATARFYVNAGTGVTASTGIVNWPGQSTFIGDRSAAGRAFQGTIDEIRISSVARNENYIRTSYANQNEPAGFVDVGAEELSS